MKEVIVGLFHQAGIMINGPHPWDIHIHDERFYQRVWADQSLGLGESYVDGWWDCAHIDQMITRLLDAKIDKTFKPTLKQYFYIISHRIFNFQNKLRAKEVAEKHYNLGNDLYSAMLDSSMNYSCGYWKYAKNLEESQVDKMELICKKMMLRPGLKVLDLGCGWGGLARYAAENYGVEVTGLTISAPQKALAEKRCQGLPVKILLQDYRDLPPEQFDRIISVGMFEHVGYKNYPEFINIAFSHLKEEGLFLLHTIGSNVTYVTADEWINKYIFPNGMLPSIVQIGEAIENRFIMEDWHNFGADYDKTLMAWYHNFKEKWSELKHQYDERFYRMWSYYLLACAGSFRARTMQLWQVVLTKNGLRDGFRERDLADRFEKEEGRQISGVTSKECCQII